MLHLSRKKRKAYKEGLRVQFQDEAPRIGSGWRTVLVKITQLRIGRKRPRIIDVARVVEVSTGHSARIPIRIWHEIASSAAKRAARCGSGSPSLGRKRPRRANAPRSPL